MLASSMPRKSRIRSLAEATTQRPARLSSSRAKNSAVSPPMSDALPPVALRLVGMFSSTMRMPTPLVMSLMYSLNGWTRTERLNP